ncbi:MAG: hypothetical protein K0U59_09330 [Gammaproteobacteria bacterium]|nr:hypothetical protein [Gammaproteobacteria bacterium]
MIVKKVLVGMGKTEIVRQGNNIILDSGSLTYCSAFVFKIRDLKTNTIVGIGMSHRGIETKHIFRSNFKNAFNSLGDIKDFKVEPIALQTAPSTIINYIPNSDKDHPKGDHECTLYAIAQDIEAVAQVNTDELLSLAEQGPSIGYATNTCTAKIDGCNGVTIEKRKGFFINLYSIFSNS